MVVHVDMHKQHEIDQSSRFTRCDHRVCGGGQATTQWLPGEHEKAAWAWLKGLDGGRGSLSLGVMIGFSVDSKQRAWPVIEHSTKALAGDVCCSLCCFMMLHVIS